MGKVILVVGLPGSGKTTYAQSLLKDGDTLLDDPKDWSQVETALLEMNNGKLFITDPLLCLQSTQEKAKEKLKEFGCELEWIFFENDPNQCQINAQTRPDKKVTNEIKYFSKKYFLPSNVKPLPVFKKKI